MIIGDYLLVIFKKKKKHRELEMRIFASFPLHILEKNKTSYTYLIFETLVRDMKQLDLLFFKV